MEKPVNYWCIGGTPGYKKGHLYALTEADVKKVGKDFGFLFQKAKQKGRL